MNNLANLDVSEEIDGRETYFARGLLINFNVERLVEGIRRMKI